MQDESGSISLSEGHIIHVHKITDLHHPSLLAGRMMFSFHATVTELR